MSKTLPKLLEQVARDWPGETAQMSKDGEGIFRPTTYAELRLWRLPGLWLTILGGALAAVCLLASLLASPVQGVTVEPDEGGLVVSLHGAEPRLRSTWGRRALSLRERIARAVAEPEPRSATGAGA